MDSSQINPNKKMGLKIWQETNVVNPTQPSGTNWVRANKNWNSMNQTHGISVLDGVFVGDILGWPCNCMSNNTRDPTNHGALTVLCS